MQKCRQWGSEHDRFAKHVQINYRGKPAYGTAVGGYVSLCTRILIVVLALCEVWACFFDQKHKESIFREQLDIPNKVVYEIGYDQGFPSFSIQTRDDENSKTRFNNDTMFYFKFKVRGYEGKQNIDAISCKAALKKYISNEESRQ